MDEQDTTNQSEQPEPAPDFSDDEMKMPEEQFASSAPVNEGPSMLIPALVGLLIILLVALGALIVWGDTLMNAFAPDATTEPTAEQSNDSAETADTSVDDLETELENATMADIESDLDAIDAEIESETATETQ